MATLPTAILRLLLRNCKKDSNTNFWTQTAFNWKPLLTTCGKWSKILTS